MDSLFQATGLSEHTGASRDHPAAGAGSHRLATRLATAAIGMPLTLLAVVLGTPWLVLGTAGLIVIGLNEFYRMAERAGYRPVRAAGMIAGVLFAVAAAWPQTWESLILPALLVSTVAAQLPRGRPERVLANTGLTVLGALYVGYLFSYILRLRALAIGPGHTGGPAPALELRAPVPRDARLRARRRFPPGGAVHRLRGVSLLPAARAASPVGRGGVPAQGAAGAARA